MFPDDVALFMCYLAALIYGRRISVESVHQQLRPLPRMSIPEKVVPAPMRIASYALVQCRPPNASMEDFKALTRMRDHIFNMYLVEDLEQNVFIRLFIGIRTHPSTPALYISYIAAAVLRGEFKFAALDLVCTERETFDLLPWAEKEEVDPDEDTDPNVRSAVEYSLKFLEFALRPHFKGRFVSSRTKVDALRKNLANEVVSADHLEAVIRAGAQHP